MLSEVLYSALIGALVALIWAVIFGIPKLIGFVIKKTRKNSNSNDQGGEEK